MPRRPTFSLAGESRQRVRLAGGNRAAFTHKGRVFRLTICPPLRTPVLRESLRRFCGVFGGAGGTHRICPRLVLPPCVLFLEISVLTNDRALPCRTAPGAAYHGRTHGQPCRGRCTHRPLALPLGELSADRRTVFPGGPGVPPLQAHPQHFCRGRTPGGPCGFRQGRHFSGRSGTCPYTQGTTKPVGAGPSVKYT